MATSKPKFMKTTKRKYMGDDVYSWAVFSKLTGRVLVTGCSKTEAEYYQRQYEKELP